MKLRPPPRLVVRRQDAAGQRQQLIWLGAAWLASLLLVAGLVIVFSGRSSGDHQANRAARAELAALQQQVDNLRRAAQVDAVATRSLRGTLAQREEEINGLRADLGFYTRLVGGDTQRQGLRLQEVRLRPITGSRGWNLTLSLTQNARRDADISGTVTVSVEGLRAGQVVQLDWPALGDTTQKDGLAFHFKYFQALHATFVLPAGFRPTRLQVHVAPRGEPVVERSIAWAEALASAPPAGPPA